LKPASSRSLQVIDLARTAAILPVMALHLKPNLPPPHPSYIWAWDRNGGYGVLMFFVISGFLITRVLAEGSKGAFQASWKKFYVQRAGRILPLFLLILSLGLLFALIFRDNSSLFSFCFKLPDHPADWTFWGPLILFLFNWARCFLTPLWGGIGAYWGVCWSLAVEEQFYLFYPLILRKLKNEKNLIQFLWGVVLFGLLWRLAMAFISFPDSVDIKYASFGCFDQIALGALLYFTHKNFSKTLLQKPGLCWVLTLCGSALFVAANLFTNNWNKIDFIYSPLLAGLSVFFFLLGGLNLTWFESGFLKLFTLPGKYSYGNYLYHIAVIYFLAPYLQNLHILLAFIILVVATTALSAFSFNYFEVPVNHYIRNRFGASRVS